MKCGIKAWTQEFPGLWSFLAFCQQPTAAEAYIQVLQTRATPRYQQHKDPAWIWNMPNRPNCARNQGGWKCREREKPHFKQKLPLRRCVDAKNTKLHIYFFSHSSLRPNYSTRTSSVLEISRRSQLIHGTNNQPISEKIERQNRFQEIKILIEDLDREQECLKERAPPVWGRWLSGWKRFSQNPSFDFLRFISHNLELTCCGQGVAAALM